MPDLTVTDIQHQLFVLTLHGKLHLAPLSKQIHNVLDIATGTGIWAIDFGMYAGIPQVIHAKLCEAIKYPTANVLGTDLSPIQPELCVARPVPAVSSVS
jgi:methylase of polypeptide subunit release factors